MATATLGQAGVSHSDLLSAGLRELRVMAASRGIDVTDLDKYAIINRIAAHEEETEEMRRECARRGLDIHGDRKALQLRLEANSGDAVSGKHRKFWFYAGIAMCVLGGLVLGISIPHISKALMRLTGMPTFFAVLFAIVVDFGICTFKVVDSLSVKFKLSTKTHWWVTAGMIICLGVSACLNASEFLVHAQGVGGQFMQVGLAVFISGFVFILFLIGSSMLLKCEERTAEDEIEAQSEIDPAQKLRMAADELDRLRAIASKL